MVSGLAAVSFAVAYAPPAGAPPLTLAALDADAGRDMRAGVLRGLQAAGAGQGFVTEQVFITAAYDGRASRAFNASDPINAAGNGCPLDDLMETLLAGGAPGDCVNYAAPSAAPGGARARRAVRAAPAVGRRRGGARLLELTLPPVEAGRTAGALLTSAAALGVDFTIVLPPAGVSAAASAGGGTDYAALAAAAARAAADPAGLSAALGPPLNATLAPSLFAGSVHRSEVRYRYSRFFLWEFFERNKWTVIGGAGALCGLSLLVCAARAWKRARARARARAHRKREEALEALHAAFRDAKWRARRRALARALLRRAVLAARFIGAVWERAVAARAARAAAAEVAAAAAAAAAAEGPTPPPSPPALTGEGGGAPTVDADGFTPTADRALDWEGELSGSAGGALGATGAAWAAAEDGGGGDGEPADALDEEMAAALAGGVAPAGHLPGAAAPAEGRRSPVPGASALRAEERRARVAARNASPPQQKPRYVRPPRPDELFAGGLRGDAPPQKQQPPPQQQLLLRRSEAVREAAQRGAQKRRGGAEGGVP